MAYFIMGGALPYCYKEGEPPNLDNMTWDEMKELAKTSYNNHEADAHYSRDVTEKYIQICHTDFAKHRMSLVREENRKIFKKIIPQTFWYRLGENNERQD